jgi:hypothetical protein
VSQPTVKSRARGVTDVSAPWDPPLTEMAEVNAIKALYAGAATEDQQRLVCAWLLKASGANTMTFRPGVDGDRATAFAEGKRHVGRMFFDLARTVLANT